MKTRKQGAAGTLSAASRALLPAILVLALTIAARMLDAAPQARNNPLEKGAAGLLLRPPPERLPSEFDNAELRPLAEGWQRLAPELVRVSTVRSNQVARIAIHRIRAAPGRPILLCLHGVLADHETWRFVAGALVADYELWLVDLPGCGESDPLRVSRAEPDAYSLTAMGERVLCAVRDRREELAPGQRLTLVGHSLGASVVLRMISSPELQARYAGILDRVDRAVMVAPCDFAVSSVPPKFIPVLGLSHWKGALGDALGATDPRFRAATRASYHRPDYATLEQQHGFAHTILDSTHLEATRLMLLSAVPFDLKTRRPKWPEIDRLLADYTRIRTPVLVVYGEWDETLPASMGNKLKDEIPGAWLVKVPRRGHSLPTEDPQICVSLIRWFQQGCQPSDLFTGTGLKIYHGLPGPLFGATDPRGP